MPLPRFWYLPYGLKAAVVMTGDDHAQPRAATEGTVGQFNARPERLQPTGLRGRRLAVRARDDLSFPQRGLSNSRRRRLPEPRASRSRCTYGAPGTADGAQNPTDQNCHNVASFAGLTGDLVAQLNQLAGNFPSIVSPVTSRSHCIVWSGWVDVPRAERAQGIRLDTNYYYWPGGWVRPPGPVHRVGLPDALRQHRRLARRRLPGRIADHRRVRPEHPHQHRGTAR